MTTAILDKWCIVTPRGVIVNDETFYSEQEALEYLEFYLYEEVAEKGCSRELFEKVRDTYPVCQLRDLPKLRLGD